ncbi:MAG: tetratricopeptide repeat protein, partial [Microvirga sp.]
MASMTGSTLKAAYGVVGTPVNLAARLQGRASAGETLISPLVKEAVERYVELEPLGALEFKGLDAPVNVWRVISERREAAASATLPLIGRRPEMGLLTSLLDAAREAGQGKVVHLRGEAGIGKTRITQKLAEEGRARGFSCHAALVLDFGAGQGRDATRALVGSLLGLAPDATAIERQAAAAKAIEDGTVAAEDMVFLADLLDVRQRPEDRALYDTMDPPARSRGRQRVTARVIRTMSSASPLLLIVEDVHWIEPNILDDLAAISEVASNHPLILAMTSRFEGDPIGNSFRTRVRAGITTIDLGPMRAEEASEFGKHLRIANDAVLKRCVARAEGNPLFLEQLLRNSEEAATEGEVPASVQSLILARMDRLDPRDKAALQAASIAGQRFSIEFVQRLTNDQQFSPSALLQHQMIRREGAEFLFTHALVRDGVYSSITHARRRSLHHAAADWYVGRDRGLRAEHLELAGDAGAPAAYHEAALAQASDHHYDKALSLAGRGRAVAVKDSDCFALDLLRGEFLRELGRAAESRTAFEAALSHADGSLQRSRAQIGIAAADRVLSQTESALSALADAQVAAEAEGGLLEQAQVHYYRGNILFARGDAKGCMAEHQAALAIAKECGATEWQVRALSGHGDAHYSVCRMRTGLDAFRDCVALCDRHGLGRVALPNRIMMGHCMTYLRQSDAAIAVIREAHEIARRSGNPLTEMLANQSLGFVTILSGQPDEAEKHMATALNQARSLGARRYEASILVVLAECALHRGRPAEALQLASEAVAICRDVGMGFVGPYSLAVLGRVTPDPTSCQK